VKGFFWGFAHRDFAHFSWTFRGLLWKKPGSGEDARPIESGKYASMERAGNFSCEGQSVTERRCGGICCSCPGKKYLFPLEK